VPSTPFDDRVCLQRKIHRAASEGHKKEGRFLALGLPFGF
jgi:hypothetical protein